MGDFNIFSSNTAILLFFIFSISFMITSFCLLVFLTLISKKDKKFMKWKVLSQSLVSLATLILALSFMTITYNGLKILLASKQKSDLSIRIENIASALKKNSNELVLIQAALEERVQLVEELKEEARIEKNTADISSEQAHAIEAKLSQVIESNNSKSFWPNVLNNLFFCILGAIIPVLGGLIRKVFTKKKTTNSNISTYNDEEKELIEKLYKIYNQDKDNE